MTSHFDNKALKDALAKKRRELLPGSILDPDAPLPGVGVKYVGCRTCNEVEAFGALMMNGANPKFCRCEPGDENLFTFVVNVPTEEEPEEEPEE